jgi:hypothetical protein
MERCKRDYISHGHISDKHDLRGLFSIGYEESGIVSCSHHNNIEFELVTYKGLPFSAYLVLPFSRIVWKISLVELHRDARLRRQRKWRSHELLSSIYGVNHACWTMNRFHYNRLHENQSLPLADLPSLVDQRMSHRGIISLCCRRVLHQHPNEVNLTVSLRVPEIRVNLQKP